MTVEFAGLPTVRSMPLTKRGGSCRLTVGLLVAMCFSSGLNEYAYATDRCPRPQKGISWSIGLSKLPRLAADLGFASSTGRNAIEKNFLPSFSFTKAATQKRLPSTVASPRNSGCDGF
jgi:hypothetical protein